MTRLFIVFLSLFAGLVSVTAQAQPTASNTLSISAAFEFTSMDPSKNGYIFSRMQVIETLLDVNAKGELVPALASDWRVSDDAKTWTFTLRDQVKFHDGSPLNAEAVVKSLKIALEKHGALRKAPIVAIKALDQKTVAIELSKPYVVLGAVLANYANAILSPAAYGKEGEVLALSATGPYQLLQFSPPHKLVVEKFDDYWGKKASIPYASYLTGHRAESRVLQARSGQADVVFGLDPASIPLLKRLPTLSLHSDAIPRTIVIKLNSGDPQLKDVKARKALSYALNRSGIAAGVLRIPGAGTEQIMPASMGDWHLNIVNQEDNGQQKASALLAELGWQKNADGYLEKDGKVFSIRLITYADRPELTKVATAIQAQWEAIGVKTKVDVTNSSAIPMGHQDGSLQAALIARNYGFIANPLAVILADYGSNGGGDWGAMNWHNAQVSELLSKLEKTTDPVSFRQYAQQVAQFIYDERPVIPVTSYVQQTSVSKRVKGFHFDPFERSFFINDMEFAR